MKKINPNDPETRSPDLLEENIAALKALFPEAITEGKIDFDVLKDLLGGAVDERDEKFGLNWFGKRKARQLALTPSTGTLRPCPEDSVDWDTTQNMIIEGDNLEVLKLMQRSYAGKVKLIYIDPPYNTGGDFIYSDDFCFRTPKMERRIGIHQCDKVVYPQGHLSFEGAQVRKKFRDLAVFRFCPFQVPKFSGTV